MIFADFFSNVERLTAPISVKEIGAVIDSLHSRISKISYTPVEIDERVILGYTRWKADAEYAIRYSQDLNRCWRRFVCCKELMHVFDNSDEVANSIERFMLLLSQLGSSPMPEDWSEMLKSEFDAEWMAILTLCPPHVRDLYQEEAQKESTRFKVAMELRIPETFVRALGTSYYDDAYKSLVTDKIAG